MRVRTTLTPIQMKGILNKDHVLNMREQYFRFMTEDGDTGILAKGTNPRDGIFSGQDWRQFLLPGALRVFNGLSDEGVYVEKVFKAHVADFYQEFKSNVVEPLEEFVGKLRNFQDPMLLKRTLLRCNVPGGETTPVHYDQIFLRAGPPNSITGWIPLGDCPLVGGGLMYLENSVPVGQKFEADFAEKSKALTDEERISAFNRNMMAGGFWTETRPTLGSIGVGVGSSLTMRPVMSCFIIHLRFTQGELLSLSCPDLGRSNMTLAAETKAPRM